MGNSQGKESRPGSSRGHGAGRSHNSATASGAGGTSGTTHNDASHAAIYSSRSGRGSRHDLSFLGLGSGTPDAALEPRRETKAEREARKLEKERILRAQERERSIREEGVDGGYLVTLGTYTGPEDFSKPVVRQLQIERRLAPFWKGLNDHSDTWTEHQLVAVVNGRPLPPADEIPPEEPPQTNPSGNNLSAEWNPRRSSNNINGLTVPITSRSLSQGSDRSASLSPSHPAFSLPSPSSPMSGQTSSSPFFRGRAKTLAALTTGSRNSSQLEMTKQEIHLPKDLYINGQRIEVFLYKDAAECPICFLYYPPYLNKTRCCDQPICSECFVQIKRPDPHPPHDPSDPNAPNTPEPDTSDEIKLVSEPAACPFCVQPEFGVTYEPPPFRRGLAYANQTQNPSAMSSSTSLNSQGVPTTGRRRATSLAANDSQVITTDRVRPDWSKKLADARAHALRRAAAATALHNAAYMMGNIEAAGSRSFGLGRRRRNLVQSESAGSSGQATPPRREGESSASSSRVDATNDLVAGRQSSRAPRRLEDLEELMMMEAIRLSIAAEEERKRRAEKEAAKEAKREEKRKAKEAKRTEKANRKSAYMASTSDANASLDGEAESSTAAGKGKAVDRSGGALGFNPLTEPTSTLNTNGCSSSRDDPQGHLEKQRAQLTREMSDKDEAPAYDPAAAPATEPVSSHRSALRKLSNASSSASSLSESVQGSAPQSSQDFGASSDLNPSGSGVNVDREETPNDTPGTEPMFNFTSLQAVISEDGKSDDGPQYTEDIAGSGAAASAPSLPPSSSSPMSGADGPEGSSTKLASPDIAIQAADDGENKMTTPSLEPNDSNLEESVTTIKPNKDANAAQGDDGVAVPNVEGVPNVSTAESRGVDSKGIEDVTGVSLTEGRERGQVAQ